MWYVCLCPPSSSFPSFNGLDSMLFFLILHSSPRVCDSSRRGTSSSCCFEASARLRSQIRPVGRASPASSIPRAVRGPRTGAPLRCDMPAPCYAPAVPILCLRTAAPSSPSGPGSGVRVPPSVWSLLGPIVCAVDASSLHSPTDRLVGARLWMLGSRMLSSSTPAQVTPSLLCFM